MKKLILFSAFTLLVVTLFANVVEPISKFIDSKSFERFVLNSKFAQNVEPNFEKAKVIKKRILNKSIDVVCLPLENSRGKILGYIEAIELKKGRNILLPNDDDYFMMYRDFADFNLE